MASTAGRLNDLETAIASWRTQEYIALPFFTLYLHYCISTMEEEVARVHPQKRWTGKIIFYIVRYGTILYIILDLHTSYRTYLQISPVGCKILFITNSSIKKLIAVTADVTMGLCVSALLGARQMYFIFIILLCAALPLVTFGLQLRGYILISAEPTSTIDNELGYPCYLPDPEAQKATWPGGSLGVFTYLSFARAALLTLLAAVTAFTRYKANGGQLLNVIGRDGGIYYLSTAGVLLSAAIINTPGVTQPGGMVSGSLMRWVVLV
ncbi:hypothetical protein FA13DRAFT_1091924 [Coprinellus micaceus]|uniref:Uncharacterized protein n=1 Tax=Coprinellus micaceus TaxID=71717 RepID=A0A4Y7TS20_COPMI|nr:hypothetical protein FA13DRAFT_1091924 [Coprinellus micaceus]